jgi:iron donor protein CyaY
VLASIEATVDRWLQDDVIDIDPQRTGGLLELSFPDGSKIVVNTQPPLQELWLAAGGYHFRCEAGRWVDTKRWAPSSSRACRPRPAPRDAGRCASLPPGRGRYASAFSA